MVAGAAGAPGLRAEQAPRRGGESATTPHPRTEAPHAQGGKCRPRPAELRGTGWAGCRGVATGTGLGYNFLSAERKCRSTQTRFLCSFLASWAFLAWTPKFFQS